MIDADALAAMKPGAWLINVARGRARRRPGAAPGAPRRTASAAPILDTFRDEPLPPTSPFYDLPNVIVTPHTSWSSGRVLDRSVELFCDNLRRFAAGEPLLNVVDPAPGTEPAARPAARAGRHRAACRSRSSGLPDRARRPSSTRSPAATPRPAASAAWSSTSASSRCPTSGSTGWPRSSSRRRSSRPTSPTSTCRRRRPRPRATSGPRTCPPSTSRGCATRDALLHVVRAFEDPANPASGGLGRPAARPRPARHSSSSSPTSPSSTGALERLQTSGRHGTPAEREANEREEAVLGRLKPALEAGLADPRRRARRRRGEGDPRLPLPDPEAGPRPAERRRGRPRRGRGARRGARRGLRPPPGARRRPVGADRDGARRARARRGGRLHGGARDRRVGPRPGDRASATGCSG